MSASTSRVKAIRTDSLIAFIAAAVILASCSGEPDTEAAPAAPSGPRAVTVSVSQLETQQVQSVRELTGRARAYAEAEIRPQVTGLIQKRLFTEGQQVAAGDALYQIDPAEYRAAVDSAAAALKGSEATADAARERVKRFKQLAEINAVSQQDYDEAVATLNRAEADIGIRKAALARARIDLDRTVVRSPIAGQIGRSTVTPGALVTANQATALARVLQLDPIYIDLSAASSEMLRWKQEVFAGRILTTNGTETAQVPVTIKLENGTEYPEKGQLGFSEVNVDENAGTVIMRAVIPNSERLLLPGMFITASFSAGSYDDVFLVPQRYVQRTQKGDAYVYVANSENKAEERYVTILESNGANWVVTDGLNSGDRLVTTGFQNLRNGTPLNITGGQASLNGDDDTLRLQK